MSSRHTTTLLSDRGRTESGLFDASCHRGDVSVTCASVLSLDASAMAGGECPVVWWDHAGGEAQSPGRAAPCFLDWLAAEVRDRAAEEKWSYLMRLAFRLRAVLSFARDVLRARAK